MRELDAWVAENVMEWTNIEPHPNCGFLGDCPTGSKSRCAVSYLTTDPAAAFAVLEKCGDKASMTVVKGETTGEWYVIADRSETYPMPNGELPNAKAETLALAVCLFARKLYDTKTTAPDEQGK